MSPDDVAAFLDGNSATPAGFNPQSPRLTQDEKGWESANPEHFAALRDLLTPAIKVHGNKPVSHWLEKSTGVRRAQEIHGPLLGELVEYVRAAGTEAINAEILESAQSPF